MLVTVEKLQYLEDPLPPVLGCSAPSSSKGSDYSSSSILSGTSMAESSSSSAELGGPVPILPRSGRNQQRYAEGGQRLVAGCIPIRTVSGRTGPDSMEVCLITSSGGRGLVLPKGGWEDDETVEIAAQRETMEEAGVRGVLELPMLGMFHFQSAKQERLHSVQQGKCVAHMYVMTVQEELEVWPESPERQRFWVPLLGAAERCRHVWMKEALATLVQNRGWGEFLQPDTCNLSRNACDATAQVASIVSAAADLPGQN